MVVVFLIMPIQNECSKLFGRSSEKSVIQVNHGPGAVFCRHAAICSRFNESVLNVWFLEILNFKFLKLKFINKGKIFFITFSELTFCMQKVLFLTEEILYIIERERTMAHYCTHLCPKSGKILK